MRTLELSSQVTFREHGPNSEPVWVDAHGRIIRFSLKPGQSIDEHRAPSSPFYVVVIKGEGVFTGGDKTERRVGPDTLLVFDPGETHSVRALDEELIFVGFLHGAPGTRADHTGGSLSRS